MTHTAEIKRAVPPTPPPHRRGWFPVALVQAARPRQWIKNLLVFAAPGAAGFGVLFDTGVLVDVLVTFVAFCMAASGTYLLNDAMDAEADRRHPTKRVRPVAAGIISVPVACGTAVVLMTGSVLLTLLAVNAATALAVALYALITTAYSLGLKNVPIIDIAAVAAGFVIRAVAGGTAAEIPISEWFLIVTSFGSLFVVSGKRYAECLALGGDAASHRRVLDEYTPDFIGRLKTTSLTVTTIAYCIWAFEKGTGVLHPIWFQLSIAPFLLTLWRYSMQLERGHGGAPEDLVLGDRFLQGSFVCWLAVFCLGVYSGG